MLDKPEFWVGLAFLIFLGIMAYVKAPALIGKALDDRAEQIRKTLDEARKLREDAQALLADYRRKHREADEEAKAIIERARRDAEAFAEETKRALSESVERRTRLAEEKIARAEAQAMSEVRAAAVDLAIGAAERIVRDRVAGPAGAGLIEQSIRDLKGRLS
jgi:F-type H+-transporting ATPase subunit b